MPFSIAESLSVPGFSSPKSTNQKELYFCNAWLPGQFSVMLERQYDILFRLEHQINCIKDIKKLDSVV